MIVIEQEMHITLQSNLATCKFIAIKTVHRRRVKAGKFQELMMFIVATMFEKAATYSHPTAQSTALPERDVDL